MNDFQRQQIERELEEQQYPQQQYSSPTTFNDTDYDNLIKWQLDIKEELVRIEHLLRKHVPKVTADGKGVIYVDPPKEDQLFNEAGVNEIMNLLAWYLNKNIILSNFSEDEIRLRCRQFNDFLADFILNNYQRFGLDNKDKIKHYPIVVMNITNTVEAAYHRALNGSENKGLRTARNVQQTEPIGNPYAGYNQPQKRRNFFKPSTW